MDHITLFCRRLSRHGLLGTARLVPVNLRWALRQLYPNNLAERRRERALDRQLGIDTAGFMSNGALQAETNVAGEITRYLPVPLSIFEQMTACLPAELSSYTFIDVGSGKGRALVLAAQRGFGEIIGVELSPILHRVAERNLAKICGAGRVNIRSLNMDARQFEFPVAPTVIFFGNPFGETITRQVVGNIERAHAASDARVFFLYHWPAHRNVLEDSEMWRELDRGAWRKEFGFGWRTYGLVRQPQH